MFASSWESRLVDGAEVSRMSKAMAKFTEAMPTFHNVRIEQIAFLGSSPLEGEVAGRISQAGLVAGDEGQTIQLLLDII